MAIPTIPEAIARGQVSIYLAAIDNAKGSLFGPRLSAPGSSSTIAMVTNILSWGYDGGAQTAQSLRGVANYLVWLCGMYGQQAQYILQGSGGGSVVPGGNIYSYTNLVDTIGTQSNDYQNDQLIGGRQVETMTVNGGPLQTIEGGDFTFDSETGTITWSQTFFVNDIIAIPFLRLIQ